VTGYSSSPTAKAPSTVSEAIGRAAQVALNSTQIKNAEIRMVSTG
jgi:hypothetical protein